MRIFGFVCRSRCAVDKRYDLRRPQDFFCYRNDILEASFDGEENLEKVCIGKMGKQVCHERSIH